jgi:REP element-mobilizing transposase RayT
MFPAAVNKMLRIHEYIGAITEKRGRKLLAAGGMPDHLHLLISLGRECTVADLLRDINAISSKRIHETLPNTRDFTWQSGAAARVDEEQYHVLPTP